MAEPDLLRAARIGPRERNDARRRLAALEAAGRAARGEDGRWLLPEAAGLIAGTLSVHPDGYAFLRPDDGASDDLYVPAREVRPAMHGDRVLVEPARRRRGGQPHGRVVRVLERAVTRVVGILRTGRTAAVVVPRDPHLCLPIVVTGGVGQARDGELVVARLVRWPTRTTDAEAEIERALGDPGDPRVETDAVIAEHDLPVVFPPAVQAAARRLHAGIDAAELAHRLDLRALPLVTIDGENARDFDDAICVEAQGSGFRLTVAVADVAHYVPVDGPIDREARARGTSVYFPDRVVPMLPEALSNDLASLRPGEDRLVQAVQLDCDARGRVRGARFHQGVMRSAARLTYTQVRQALVDHDPAVRRDLGRLIEPLEQAERLARQLRARRFERGAIDFDLPEAEVVLDLRGQPEQILRAERSIAHQIIEDSMLAANEAVARELARRGVPSLHRVHEPPPADRLRELARFLEGLGLRLQLEHGHATPRAFQHLLGRVAGRPEERLVNTVLLRTMQQARYAAEPLGHFGLATDTYTHFTSPIRRYPDLVVHRLLAGGRRGSAPPDLPAIAAEASRRERVALDAEREILQLKRIQLMQDKVGQEFDGVVSGVPPFGLFVELRDVFVEGLVHLSTLDDDFYEHQPTRHALRGRRTRRMFRLGDPVRVVVTGASVARRQIDFVLSDAEERKTPWRRPRRHS